MLLKKYRLLFFVSVAFVFCSYCQTATTEQQIINLSKRKFEWMIHKNMDSLSSILDDNLKYIHSNGWAQTKKDVIDDLNSGKLVIQKVDVENAEVRIYNNTAILNGKGKFEGIVNDKPFSFELMYTEVYIKQNNKWMLASRHANKLQ